MYNSIYLYVIWPSYLIRFTIQQVNRIPYFPCDSNLNRLKYLYFFFILLYTYTWFLSSSYSWKLKYTFFYTIIHLNLILIISLFEKVEIWFFLGSLICVDALQIWGFLFSSYRYEAMNLIIFVFLPGYWLFKIEMSDEGSCE